jgi:orotate phosphoribosyltransferase-like protein
MTERNELINDIQRLKVERNRLLEQIKEAEQWESVSWDSYHALVDHINAMEKKQKIARNYWNTSQQDIKLQFESVLDQNNRLKKVIAKKRYDLLESELDKLTEEVRQLADVLGIEIDELPQDFPFFALPAEEIDNE